MLSGVASPMQCEATTLRSAYRASHRCEKTKNLMMLGRHWLCAHHRNKNEKKETAAAD